MTKPKGARPSKQKYTYFLGLRCAHCLRLRADQSLSYCADCRARSVAVAAPPAKTSEWFDDCQGLPTRLHGDLANVPMAVDALPEVRISNQDREQMSCMHTEPVGDDQ